MTKERNQQRFWLLCSIAFIAVMGLLVGWVTFVYKSRQQRTRNDVQKRLAAIHASGQPLTWEDLAKIYPDPPPEHNARILLKPALDALNLPGNREHLLFFDLELSPSDPLEESAISEAHKWLEKNRIVFDSIPWSKMNNAWFGLKFTNASNNFTPLPKTTLDLTRLFCLKAAMEAEEHQTHKGIQALEHDLVIIHAIRNDIPLDVFVKQAIEKKIIQSLLRLVNSGKVDDADLVSISKSLSVTNTGALKQAWIGNDRVLQLWIAEQTKKALPRNKTTYSPVRELLEVFKQRLMYRDEDMLKYLDWCDRCTAAWDMPATNAIPLFHTIDVQAVQFTTAKIDHTWLWFNKTSLFGLMSEKTTSDTYLRDLESVANSRLALTLLAIERWRNLHNDQVPDDLNSLVPDCLPALLKDPFDDRPIRYKKLDKGYSISSIGRPIDSEELTDSNSLNANRQPIIFTITR